MNTPSKEALDAARDLFKQRNCFASDNDNAAIIDRHFEPLRAEIVQLTIDRDNWKIRAEEMDEYKADCMELRQRAKQAVARVKEVETDLSSLRVAYEQNASQCVQLNRELAMKPDTVEWLNGVTIQRQRAEQAEAHIADLVAALREVDEIVNDANHSAEDRLCAAANRLLNTRAESATPAKHPDTERGVKHARKLNGLAAWLEHEADVRKACATNEGDRWDAMRMSECAEAIREYAARKQGGEK